MGWKDIEQVRQKVDAEEDLSAFVETPVEKLDKRKQTVGLEHIVTVFADATKLLNDFDHWTKCLA